MYMFVKFISILFVGATFAEQNVCDIIGNISIPDAGNCNKYFQCINGTQIAFYCENDFLFDIATLSCKFPQDAKCFPYSIILSSITYAICPPTGGPFIVPHLYDCRRYHMCFGGNVIGDYICEDGDLFDNPSLQCRLYSETVCSPGATPPTTTTTPAPLTTLITTTQEPIDVCQPEGNHLAAHPYDCSKYFFCVNGLSIEYICKNAQLYHHIWEQCVDQVWSECFPGATTATTLTTVQTTTIREPDEPCQGLETGLVPNHENCSLYYVCYNGEAISFECAEGLLFDIIQQKCTTWDVATCYSGAISPPPISTTTSMTSETTTSNGETSTTAEESTTIITLPETTGTIETTYESTTSITTSESISTSSQPSSDPTNSTETTNTSGSTNSTETTNTSGSTNSTETTNTSGSTNSTETTNTSGSTNSTGTTNTSGSTNSSGTTNTSGSTNSTGTTNTSGSTNSTGTTNTSSSTNSTGTTNTSGSSGSSIFSTSTNKYI